MKFNSSIKALVIDRDAVSCRLAGLLLQRLGQPAPDFAESCEVLPNEPYPLVLAAVDAASGPVELPRARSAAVRLIAVVARDSEPLRQACLSAGADEVLTKPLTLPALAAALSDRADDLTADFDTATWAELRALFGAEGAARIARALIDDLPSQEAQLTAASRDGHCAGLRRLAHTLHGVSLQLGANVLAGLWSQVEAAASAGDATKAALLAAAAIQRHRSLIARLRNDVTV